MVNPPIVRSTPRPSPAHQYIDTAEQLAAFAEANQGITWLGFDTEFINEKRFYPMLCLIQVITEHGVYILDPLRLKSLDPFLAMIEDPQILKITHAGENDYRILNSLYGTYPQNLFDTQIAMGFLTHTYPISFQNLVEKEFQITLNKSFSVTDWEARPMTSQQITYALNDVLYLPDLWQRLTSQLEQRDRLHWCQEEVAKFTAVEYYAGDTTKDFFKSTLHTQLTPPDRIFFVRLLAWRLEEAQRRNVPQDMVLQKKIMMPIVKGMGQGLAMLRQNRMIADKVIQSYGSLWERMYKTPMTDAEQALFADMPQWQEETPEQAITSEFLYLLVRDRCFKSVIAPSIVLSKSAFRSHDQSLNAGWRRELLGDSLIEWIQSDRLVTFAVETDRCVVQLVDEAVAP
jgi:ribonuclease D